MTTHPITQELINSLSYYSACKLADQLHVVNPKQVQLRGFITLDQLGNYISADVEYFAPFSNQWFK
jgi:hypothetical protein